MSSYLPQVVQTTAVSPDEAVLAKVQGCVLPPGFRFLSSTDTGQPIIEVLRFMKWRCVTAIGALHLKVSQNTVTDYAYDLCDFLSFLDHGKTCIADVSAKTLSDYVGSMFCVTSTSTGRIFANETIRRRLSTTKQFLRYCQDNGLLKNRFDVEQVTLPDDHKVSVLEPKIGEGLAESVDRNVHFIDPSELSLLMSAIGPWDCLADGIPLYGPRNRLIAELALQSGLRRAETLTLRASQVLTANLSERQPLSTFSLRVVGKGNKPRKVPVPVWLVRALQHYVRKDRDLAIEARRRKQPDFIDHGFLFVHGENAPATIGSALRPKQIDEFFSDARHRAIAARLADPDAQGVGLSSLPNCVFHSLRHAYAVNTYVARRQLGDVNPGKYVQSVLGHKDQKTTDRLYLRASHVFEAEASEFMQRQMMMMVT